MTTMTAPSRSVLQRDEALRRANEVRVKRAQLKRELKAGRRTISPLLTDPPAELLTATATELLLALPRVGRARVQRWLRVAGISTITTLGGMTERQREALVRAVSR